MAQLLRSSIQSAVACIILLTQLTGCVSLRKVEEIRRPPGPANINFSLRNVYYDPDIRGYRLKTEAAGREAALNGMVLRDIFGKKIRTERELARILIKTDTNLVEWEKEGIVTKTAYTIGFIIYLPVAIAVGLGENIIDGTLNYPFVPIASNLKTTYEEKAEEAYDQGRRQFDSQKIDDALTEWDYAKHLMPSLQGNSDIDYWRGRAFESRQEYKLAIEAYQEFLDYSERSTPTYFHHNYPEDPNWSGKAEEAERKESALIKAISLSAQKNSGLLWQRIVTDVR
jgi:tetratricopeptide (TPR) repeat protein